MFNQKLIILLKAGVSFVKALTIIIKNHRPCALKDILIKAENDINNGVSISKAFSYSQIPFQKIYTASLYSGEKSGQINSILEKYNAYLDKISTFRRKMISSLSYPVVLLTFMISIVFLVITFAIPKFADFYTSFDAQLPVVTKTLINSGT